jgi:hypothetical protein
MRAHGHHSGALSHTSGGARGDVELPQGELTTVGTELEASSTQLAAALGGVHLA